MKTKKSVLPLLIPCVCLAKDLATALAASLRMAFVLVMVSVSPGDEFLDFGTAPVALATGETAQGSGLFHWEGH